MINLENFRLDANSNVVDNRTGMIVNLTPGTRVVFEETIKALYRTIHRDRDECKIRLAEFRKLEKDKKYYEDILSSNPDIPDRSIHESTIKNIVSLQHSIMREIVPIEKNAEMNQVILSRFDPN